MWHKRKAVAHRMYTLNKKGSTSILSVCALMRSHLITHKHKIGLAEWRPSMD